MKLQWIGLCLAVTAFGNVAMAGDWPLLCVRNMTRYPIKVVRMGDMTVAIADPHSDRCSDLQKFDGNTLFWALVMPDKGLPDKRVPEKAICKIEFPRHQVYLTIRDQGSYLLCDTKTEGQPTGLVRNFYVSQEE